MTRVKLKLASGSVQEREVVTAFNSNGIKYIIFDGESTGSMGLPIVLVSKESNNKVIGITDAEEWKNTKENLKKIISGEKIEFAAVGNELASDDVYYRQLTLPISSFDILKTSYVVPEAPADEPAGEDSSIFEQITPEDITGGNVPNLEPVAPSTFSAPVTEEPAAVAPTPQEPDMSIFGGFVAVEPTPSVAVEPTPVAEEPAPVETAPIAEPAAETVTNNYEELKKEFLAGAEELFDKLYNKLNQND